MFPTPSRFDQRGELFWIPDQDKNIPVKERTQGQGLGDLTRLITYYVIGPAVIEKVVSGDSHTCPSNENGLFTFGRVFIAIGHMAEVDFFTVLLHIYAHFSSIPQSDALLEGQIFIKIKDISERYLVPIPVSRSLY